MTDLYVLYLRSYVETMRGASPPAPYQSGDLGYRTAPAHETAEEAIAAALGVEDAMYFKACGNDLPDLFDGFRPRHELLTLIAECNRAEPSPDDGE